MSITKFRSEVERTLAFGSIVAGYTAIGTPFDYPLTKLYVFNDTDARLTFSFQGATENHFTLPASGFILLDIAIDTKNETSLRKGSSLYVKRDEVPSSGSVYVTGFYVR